MLSNFLTDLGGPLDAAKRSLAAVRSLSRTMAQQTDQGRPGKAPGTRQGVRCEPVEVVLRCSAGHAEPRLYGCCKRNCAGDVCKAKHGHERKRRAASAWEAFDERDRAGNVTRALPLLSVVLGLPPDARPLVRERSTWNAVWRAADALTEQWLLGLAGLTEDGWRLGAVTVTHPEGDRSPGAWVPHWNALVPAIACHVDGRRQELRAFHVERSFAEPLRRAWAAVLTTLCGRAVPVADVWYGFGLGDKKRRHMASYFFRTFPSWNAVAQRVRRTGFLAPNFKARPPELDDAEARAEEELAELEGKARKACPVKGCSAPAWCDDSRVPVEWRRADQYLTTRQRKDVLGPWPPTTHQRTAPHRR